MEAQKLQNEYVYLLKNITGRWLAKPARRWLDMQDDAAASDDVDRDPFQELPSILRNGGMGQSH